MNSPPDSSQSATRAVAQKPRFFYGWVIVATCFALTAVGAGKFFSFGVFFKFLQEDFGWSRTATSWLGTEFVLTYAISSFFMGRLADRYGPRRIMVAAALLIGLGFALVSQVQSLWEFSLYYAMAGLGTGAIWTIPVATVQRWFIARRGLALGLGVAGVGVGAILFAPLTNSLIVQYGWRQTYLFYGVVFGLVVLASAWAIHLTPEKKGLRPYGWEALNRAEPAANSDPQRGSLSGLTTRQAMRTWAFVSTNLMYTLTVLPVYILMVHLAPYATDAGISPGAAAAALGLMGMANLPGILLGGNVGDRIGWQKAFAYSNFGMAAAIFWLLFAQDLWMLYVFVVVFGVFWGARMTQIAGIIGVFFGTLALAELTGIFEAISSIAGAAGPVLAGFIFDVSGNYTVVFIASALFNLVAGVMSLFIQPPPPQKADQAAT